MSSGHCQWVIKQLWSPAFKTRSIRGKFVPGVQSIPSIRSLSSGEAFTALKPFFFAVHPDLFGQFPRERAINENSLKQLNAYIESDAMDKPLQPTQLTFYLRHGPEQVPRQNDNQFQSVRIVLLPHKNVRMTVHSILETCNLPTSYVDSVPPSSKEYLRQHVSAASSHAQTNKNDIWNKSEEMAGLEKDIFEKASSQDTLRIWLERNVGGAKGKLDDCFAIREEIRVLRSRVCESLGVKDVIWDCGWGTRHFRGCLQSFLALATHHPEIVDILKDKTVIFGRDTGISLDGHVILNSGEVRANWHDLIKRANKHNYLIKRIPKVELALSKILKDICVMHRKFELTIMADSYESNLRKLITSIGDYRGRCNFPKNWPENLSHLELVVEADSGPLMVSPTGQIIVPSSCPPFLLVNFISERMEEASQKLAQYKRQKYEEKDLHSKCIEELALFSLDKADNITPNLMIDCLRRLVSRAEEFRPILKGSHLWVTTYYSVLNDGEMCIPWNWR